MVKGLKKTSLNGNYLLKKEHKVIDFYFKTLDSGILTLKESTIMRMLDVVTAILVVIGALNWGLYGALRLDFVASLLGDYSSLARLVYILVGLSGLYQVLFIKKIQSRWNVS